MAKRKCNVPKTKQATKKFREDSGTKHAKSNLTTNALVLDQNSSALIDCLNEDALVEIFQWLPPEDRLQIERVCKKWNQAARKSWSNFCSCKVLLKNMTNVLRRGGRFVKTLQIRVSDQNYDDRFYRSNVCEALSLTPNVKHLLLYLPSEKYALKQVIKSMLCGQLKSLSIRFRIRPSTKTLNKLLTECSQLEYLNLTGLRDYRINYLPPTLKFFDGYLGYENYANFEQLIEVIIRQNIALEGIQFPWNYAEPEPYNFMPRMSFIKMKYLCVQIWMNSLPFFQSISRKMSQLVVLEIGAELNDEVSFKGMLCTIVENCKQVQCLSFYRDSKFLNNDYVELVNLEHLTHIQLYTKDKEAVESLFCALFNKKKLQYFETDVDIDVNLVCEALHKCETLIWISCESRKKPSGTKLCRTLDQIYGRGSSPVSASDPRIRHFYFGHKRWEGRPEHPWAIFHKSNMEFFWNKFGEYNVFPSQICF